MIISKLGLSTPALGSCYAQKLLAHSRRSITGSCRHLLFCLGKLLLLGQLQSTCFKLSSCQPKSVWLVAAYPVAFERAGWVSLAGYWHSLRLLKFSLASRFVKGPITELNGTGTQRPVGGFRHVCKQPGLQVCKLQEFKFFSLSTRIWLRS